jgi:hypothetical protein
VTILRFAAACITVALVLAGCETSSPPQIVDRLPGPAVVKPEIAPPAPVTAQVAAASEPAARAIPAGWIPPGGVSKRWTSIVIHHSASHLGSLGDIHSWHMDKGWDSCGYHFVIGNGTRSGDGQIEVGPRWRQQATGAHTRLYGKPSSPEGNYYNEHGIGIVLVGNFEESPPSARQMSALVELVSYLSDTCNIHLSRVYTHGDLKATDCPGQHFSKPQLRRRLHDALAARPTVNPVPQGS